MSDVFTAYVLAPYPGSRNYEELADMACQASILCVVDYQSHRDVARTNYMRRGDHELWSVNARGISYISAFNRADFIAMCGHANLEFIAPPAASLPE